MKTKTIYVVLQQGGTSAEWYGSVCTTEAWAKEDVQQHEADSYNAFYLPVKVPADTSGEMVGILADSMANALGVGIGLERSY